MAGAEKRLPSTFRFGWGCLESFLRSALVVVPFRRIVPPLSEIALVGLLIPSVSVSPDCTVYVNQRRKSALGLPARARAWLS